LRIGSVIRGADFSEVSNARSGNDIVRPLPIDRLRGGTAANGEDLHDT
jgi:hypothetical protein